MLSTSLLSRGGGGRRYSQKHCMRVCGPLPSPVPELSFLPASYRGWTRALERRVSPFERPGSAPIGGRKKGEFRDWTTHFPKHSLYFRPKSAILAILLQTCPITVDIHLFQTCLTISFLFWPVLKARFIYMSLLDRRKVLRKTKTQNKTVNVQNARNLQCREGLLTPLYTQIIPSLRPKWPTSMPYFRPKQLHNHTLWGRTYLDRPYKGVYGTVVLR